VKGVVNLDDLGSMGYVFGSCGTGKTNELVEAQHHNQVRRVLIKWMKYDLIALDEVGYVPLAEIGAGFLFQVIAERAEKALS
jgi:DNA replication protein DnaC